MRTRLLTLLLVACFALTATTFAQVPNITDVTSTPVPGAGHSYLHGLNETVNPANGSVTLRFCVPVPRGRGLTVPFCIVYNSDGAHFLISRNAGSLVWGQSLSEFGRYSPWSYTVPRVTVQAVDVALTDGSGGTCRVAVDYVYHGTRGGRHDLGLSIFGQAPGEAGIDGNCNTAGLTLSTSGSDGPILATTTQVPNNPSGVPGTFELEPVTVTTADGTRYQFPSLSGDLLSPADPATVVASSVEDKNGNTVPISSSAGNVTYTDTLGRTAVALTNTSSTQDSVAVSGVSGQTLVNWGPHSYSFNVTMTHVAGTQACTENTNSASDSEIQSIVLPNGDTYSFGYDPTTGLVNSISYPGGGVVTYTWNETPTSSEYGSWAGPISADGGGSTGPCDYYYTTPVITDRWVSFGGSSVLHQHFDYSTTWGSTQGQWTQKQTTVTSYDLVRGGSFQTIYKYSPEFVIPQINTQDYLTGQIPVEQEIDHYDWSGAELSSVAETWLNPEARTARQTTLYGASQPEVKETTWNYNSWLEPIEKDEYDFGANSPGALLRKILTSYASFSSHIVDLPSSVITDNGGGSRFAETDYAYDQTAPTPTSGVIGKDYSSGNAGNLTTESRWVNSTNSDLNTTFTYDDTGQLLSVTNPLDAAQGKPPTETISYADNYAGGNPGSPTDAYPTTVTDSLGHTLQFSWNLASGEMASSTGENGHATTYTYTDDLGRLTQVNYPDGGETQYCYEDTTGSSACSEPAPSITTEKEISSGNWLTTVRKLDGMGNVVDTETASDPGGTDYVATTYDGEGQVYTVTNPYRSTSDPTYGVTTYAYDALGRTTSVTHPDGSVLTKTYAGRATEVADEGNGSYTVKRVFQVDGLGQLVSVCEVDATAMPVGGGKTPVACSQDIAQTGFLTTYGYDTLGNLTSVAQSGLNPRTFAYDSLSRLISADNPESGTTTYTYDTAACGAAAAPGELTCSTGPKPNQTNPSVTVTTAYTYDADSRVLTKTYSDGTPEVEFAYDQTAPWGPTLSNPVGRLTLAETLSSGSVNTGETFSYDAMGRVVTSQQCVPASWSCGTNANTLNYTYNLLGNTTSAGNGAGVTLSYAYNDAAELTSITSSLSDANHPGTLFSAPSYDAGGQLTGLTYGNNQTETDVYNDRTQLTSRSITGASSPATGSLSISGTEQSKNGTPATAGTGSVTIGGSEQSIAATSGSASVTITGSEQSGSTTATHATGSVSIGGSEQSYNYCYNAGPGVTQCQEIYQGGGVYVTINGVTEVGYYTSTADAVASELASAFNANDSSEISATASNSTVYFTTVATGTAANYSMSTSTQYSTQYWTSPSFTGSLSGATLTGGTNASTYYDSGTVSIAVNGQAFTVSYGQNSTTASIAAALASAITAGSSYASASVSGSTINLTAKTTGSGTNYALSTSSATGDSSQFSSPSFGASPSGSAFTGGQNIIYDSGTVTITVNGFAESVSYGNGSTSSSLASALASGFAGASGSPVSATASGGTVDLTSKTTGSSTNYSLSASSATGDPGQFSSPSFSTSPSGSSLTGGTAGTATTYDSGTVWAQVGSFKATVNYGQSDTDSSVATNLASALSASGSPVTATASGSTVSFTTSATGAGANLSLTVGSSTSDSTDFSSASFSASPSGSSLTGGGVGSYSVTGIGYAPDGDVTGDTDSVNGQWQYLYGPLNRLLEACDPNCTSPTTAVGYVYDRFGNRWEQNSLAGGVPAPQLTFDANNHIVGASYDASGDLLSDAAGHSYTYNAQHRIATADNNAIQYVYNAFGQRVEKSVGGVAKYYLYDPAGRAVTVLDQNGNWLRGEIFAGGRHIATYVNNTTDFDYSDWLGTERLTATLSGTEQDACTSLPYGDDFACSGPGSDPSPLHFTGQQHDAETGLDHFPGRNYTSTWATFTSPDPAPWNLADPQTLDRYVYTADNPVTLTDPTGLTPCAGKSGAPCKVKNVVEEKHPGSSSTQKPGPWRKFIDRLLGRRRSWNPTQPLPDSPSKLGPDWKRNPQHRHPHGEEYVNGKTGEKLEWNKGRPGQPGNRARDHWHYTPPGSKRGRGHFRPGDIVRKASVGATIAAGLAAAARIIIGSAPEWAPFALP